MKKDVFDDADSYEELQSDLLADIPKKSTPHNSWESLSDIYDLTRGPSKLGFPSSEAGGGRAAT
jgi:hypothetical protein